MDLQGQEGWFGDGVGRVTCFWWGGIEGLKVVQSRLGAGRNSTTPGLG